LPCLQLLKPAAAQQFAAEVTFDPKAQPQMEFATAATVTGAWTTFDPEVLDLLDELHVWGPGFLENRLRWRPKQPITVLELRAYRLNQPFVLPTREEFWGCFSWLELGSWADLLPAGVAAAREDERAQLAAVGQPALDDAAFASRQQLCQQQLGRLADVEELPF
jgi:hypothetical protein